MSIYAELINIPLLSIVYSSSIIDGIVLKFVYIRDKENKDVALDFKICIDLLIPDFHEG